MRSHHNKAGAIDGMNAPIDSSTSAVAAGALSGRGSASGDAASGSGSGSGGGGVSVAGSGAAAVSRGQKQNRGKLAGERVVGRRSSRHSEAGGAGKEGDGDEGRAEAVSNEKLFAAASSSASLRGNSNQMSDRPTASSFSALTLRERGSSSNSGIRGNRQFDGRSSSTGGSNSRSRVGDGAVARSWANAAAAANSEAGGAGGGGWGNNNRNKNIWSGGSGWSNAGSASHRHHRRQLLLVDDENSHGAITKRRPNDVNAAGKWNDTALVVGTNTTAIGVARIGEYENSGHGHKSSAEQKNEQHQQHQRRLGCKWVQHKGQTVCGEGSSSSSSATSSNTGSRNSDYGSRNSNRWSRSRNSGVDGNSNYEEGEDSSEGKMEALGGDDEAAGPYPLSKPPQQRNIWGQQRGGSGGYGRSRQRRKSDSSSSSSSSSAGGSIHGSTRSGSDGEGGVRDSSDFEGGPTRAAEANVWAEIEVGDPRRNLLAPCPWVMTLLQFVKRALCVPQLVAKHLFL